MNGNRPRPVIGGVQATGQMGFVPPQPSSAQANAQRQRQLGENAANRSAFQNDYGQANQARNEQMGAVGLSRQAAMGNAPSRAEVLGKQMIGDSLNAQMAGAASARGGPMAQAAAMRNAQAGAASFQQRGAADMAALRADEMARARGELMNGASAMRGQDLTATGMQAENERFQRNLNQQGQMGYEGMASDTDKAQAQLDMQAYLDDSANQRHQQEMEARRWEAQAKLNEHRVDKDTDTVMGFVGGAAKGVGGAIGGFLGSDPKMKNGVQDLNAPMGSHEPWMPSRGDVDAIKYGPNADEDALDDRYGQQANPAAPWLEEEMSAQPGAGPGPAPKGVAGAPQGYAASRAGQPGSMFSPGYEADPKNETMQLAPGQSDWDRYGAGASKAGEVDWTRGGTTAPPEKGGGWLGALAGGLGGIGSGMHTSDPLAKSSIKSMGVGPAGGAFDSRDWRQDGGGYDIMSPIKKYDDWARSMSNPTPMGELGKAGNFAISDPKAKTMTPDALRAAADRMERDMRSDHERRMEEGPSARRLSGGTRENDYTTELTAGAEKAYEAWRQRTAPWDTGRDYDLRGAFAEGLDRDQRGHLPDTYKKPNHETFSDESQYAKDEPESAGSWDGERYKPKGPPAWLRREVAAGTGDPRSAPPAEMMDAIGGGKAFKYKPGVGEDPTKQHFGTTTEDLKKTPMGASMVVDDAANGYDAIDVKEAIGPTIASLGNLNQRLRALEASAPRGRRGR